MKFSTLEMSTESQIESDRLLAMKMAEEVGFKSNTAKSKTFIPGYIDPNY